MLSEPSCIFCRIINGELSASVVSDDDAVIAFMDINPVTEGHLLVVPKDHHERIATIPGETLSHMTLIARWLAAAIRKSEPTTEGVNLYLADGEAAGQEVMHAHLHVIPRRRGDGFGLRVSRGATPTRSQLDEQATAIQAATVD